LRDAFTYTLDITSPLTQNMLLYLSTQTTSEADRVQLEKLAKVSKFKSKNYIGGH